MPQPLSIWIISDQRAGHENQSLGLVAALQRQTSVEWRRFAVDPSRNFLANFWATKREVRDLPAPDLIVGAGHRTHGVLLLFKWLLRRKAVVLMTPSLPAAWFDLCLIPRHDLKQRRPGANTVVTRGVLNRVQYLPERKDGSGLFLVGGACKEFGWDGGRLLEAIGEIVRSQPNTRWTMTDSRRTPDSFAPRVQQEIPAIQVCSHKETEADWMPQHLAAASQVWATEDSASMVYEALSSGASVGLLPMPPTGPPSRLAAGIASLVEENMVSRYGADSLAKPLPEAASVLQEADRCAGELLGRLFPDRT